MPYFFAPVGREQLDVLGNPAGKALYGTEPIENMGNAIIRGMKAGAAGGGLGYLAGLMEQGSGWGRTGNGLLTGMAGKTASAFIPRRDPGKGCGGISPFLQFLGYSSAKGYRYTPLQTGGVKRNREKFSIWEFFGSTLFGAVTGGVSSAAFYGAGKGIEKLWNGFRAGMSNRGIYDPNVGNYLAGKAPKQVMPGIRKLEGQYVDDLNRVQPWKAFYDEYGRIIGRTDYNAGNIAQGIPNIHYHTYEWGPGKLPLETGSHIEGEYKQ